MPGGIAYADRSPSPSGFNDYYEVDASNPTNTAGFLLDVYDAELPTGSPTPPNNLDTPYSVGVLTNVSFDDPDIGSGFLCQPGAGPCDPYYGNGYEDVVGFSVTVAPNPVAVPEPATWAMMLSGLALTGLAARRRGAPHEQPRYARASEL